MVRHSLAFFCGSCCRPSHWSSQSRMVLLAEITGLYYWVTRSHLNSVQTIKWNEHVKITHMPPIRLFFSKFVLWRAMCQSQPLITCIVWAGSIFNSWKNKIWLYFGRWTLQQMSEQMFIIFEFWIQGWWHIITKWKLAITQRARIPAWLHSNSSHWSTF